MLIYFQLELIIDEGIKIKNFTLLLIIICKILDINGIFYDFCTPVYKLSRLVHDNNKAQN